MPINWSAINNASIVGRLLRMPLRLVPRTSVRIIRRGPAKGLKWITGGGLHGCWLGTYQLERQTALERFIRPGMTVYDVGAQAGFYTMIFSRLVGAEGSVIAFEPCLFEAPYLLTHILLNKLENVRVIQAAVGASERLGGFTTDRERATNSLTDDPDPQVLVPTITIDNARLAPPDLIKIDVEGGEAGALEGARETLRSHQPIVFIVLHGFVQRRECIAMLNRAGYEVYGLDGRQIKGDCAAAEIYALPAN